MSALVFLFLVIESGNAVDSTPAPAQSILLECPEIRESSGIACSHRHPGVIWTHNDSGDENRLFAFDCDGKHRLEVEIKGAKNDDWEDLATYVREGRPQILIGDVGDNALRRKEVRLYRVNEPRLDNKKIKVDQIWDIQYPDGPVNCEAIAVDAKEGLVLLASKVRQNEATIYSVPLVTDSKHASVRATRLAAVPIPSITGMDIHSDDGRIVLVTYTDAFLYHRRVDESRRTIWQATFDQEPTLIRLPHRKQGEAICFDLKDESIWLTSEKHPAMLMQVDLPR